MGLFDFFKRKKVTEQKEDLPKNEKNHSFQFNNEENKSFTKSDHQDSHYLEIKTLPKDFLIYHPTAKEGLNEKQIKERNASKLTNKSKAASSKSVWQILFENIFTFFNILLTLIAITLIIFQKFSQLTFMIIVVVNTIIGIYQSLKAKKTIDKLKLLTTSTFTVIRKGQKSVISSEELFLNDVYEVKIGDQIPTDAIILEGKLEVNESLLTGEPIPIEKKAGDTLFAGFIVISGSAILRSEAIGDYNYISQVQAKAKVLEKPKSELVRSLNAIIKIIGIMIIPLGGLTFWTQWMSLYSPDKDLFVIASETVTNVSGSIVGMIPTGMYLLTSIALATSIISLSKHNAMVQDLYSVEMLARVDTLCLDKTGTLTDGSMVVKDVKIFDHSINLEDLMGSYLNAFKDENQTTKALLNYYQKNDRYKITNTIPFSSIRKYSAVEFAHLGTFAFGAPEYLYKGDNPEIINYVKDQQSKGYRVLLLCQGKNNIDKNGELTGKLQTVALFSLEDHVREDAIDTIAWFINNGVSIKVISGDNPTTVSEIAKKCKIPDADKYISLEGKTEEEVIEASTKYAVFGRVSPEQKAIIVQALKDKKKIVGMTGDGVNDILAMKRSDCSIAMANGSSAARNSANLVLLDSNFNSMPLAVKEGRRSINNVQRSSALYLMKTIFTVVFTIITLITNMTGGKGITYPFQPNNLLITEMVCIGFVSLFLAVQKNDAQIKGNFIQNTFIRAVPAAIILIISISINYLIKENCGFLSYDYLNNTNTELSDLSFRSFNSLTMTAVSLGMAFNCCEPLFPLSNGQNRYRAIFFLITIADVCIGVFGFGNIPAPHNSNMCLQLAGIDYRSLTWQMWLLLFIYVTIGATLVHFAVKLTEKFFEKKENKRLAKLS